MNDLVNVQLISKVKPREREKIIELLLKPPRRRITP